MLSLAEYITVSGTTETVPVRDTRTALQPLREPLNPSTSQSMESSSSDDEPAAAQTARSGASRKQGDDTDGQSSYQDLNSARTSTDRSDDSCMKADHICTQCDKSFSKLGDLKKHHR